MSDNCALPVPFTGVRESKRGLCTEKHHKRLPVEGSSVIQALLMPCLCVFELVLMPISFPLV